MTDKIKDIKSELFDIISQQEFLGSQINQLEAIKKQKLDELQKLIIESQQKEDTEKVGD